MRPAGEIQLALMQAWSQGPASVRVAAERACVGMAAAKYTATRMASRGVLVEVQAGRPAVLGLAADVQCSEATEQASGHLEAFDALLCWMHQGAAVG